MTVSLGMESGVACDCAPLEVTEARDGADVVFAGDIESVSRIDAETAREPRVIVTFRVARVWKGPVTAKFAMHSNVEFSSCGGFFREFLQPGSTLLVYGSGRPATSWKHNAVDGAPNAHSLTVIGDDSPPDRPDLLDAVPDDQIVYTTSICTRTTPVQLAVEDFEQLGPACELGPLSALPDRELVEALKPKYNGAPEACGGLVDARRWALLEQVPPNGAELRQILETDKHHGWIFSPRPVHYREYWFVAKDGAIGYCRPSTDPSVVCGNMEMEFRQEPSTSGKWRTWTGGARTYCEGVAGGAGAGGAD